MTGRVFSHKQDYSSLPASSAAKKLPDKEQNNKIEKSLNHKFQIIRTNILLIVRRQHLYPQTVNQKMYIAKTLVGLQGFLEM